MVGLLAAAWPAAAALPSEVILTKPVNLEILRNGKRGGTVALPAGEKLDLIDVQGDFVVVRYRSVSGRVPAASTNLPHMDPPVPAARPVAVVKAPPPPAHFVPTSPMEKILTGRLVALDDGALRAFATSRLAGVKFYAIYFSASWCPPCREFTPGFVDAYGKMRALYPELEVVLVNRDRSPADMAAYMRDDHMTWPALRWDAIRDTREINRYAGYGIPCLVLVDENGTVLSDSFRGGGYVGPDAVLDDAWRILGAYRKKNPRIKS